MMKTKNILVSFIAILAVISVISTVAAAQTVSDSTVYVRGISVDGDTVSVIEGETLPIRVSFTADIDATDVKVKAQIDGYKVDISDVTTRFDIEEGMRYDKSLSLKIPSELKNEISDDLTLEIKVYNKDDKTELDSIDLRVQREPYKANVMSISSANSVEAGKLIPVDIVLKNTGYNDLDDLYVTAGFKDLGVSRTIYFGDLVSVEESTDDDDDTDTVSGRIYLEMPENTQAGVYTLEVEVSNDDFSTTKSKQIVVRNDYANNAIPSVSSRTVAAGQNAEYSILVVNPTDSLKVYNIVPETTTELSVSVSESLIAVPAGTSKTVTVTANSNTEGVYNFNVNVFSGDQLQSKVALTSNVQGRALASPAIVLTVILAIVLVVLLVVLIVLVGKKPKEEDFGESYY